MRLLPALLLLASFAPAQAAIVSARPDKVAIVIYHQGRVDTAQLAQADSGMAARSGLTLVIETRTLDLPAGLSQIQFRGVAATMVPQTAEVTGLPGLSERDFDFNLLSPGALIAKSIGKSVRLIRTDSQSGAVTEQAAVISSGPDGTVLQTAAGVEALGCSGMPERLVFDSLPENLLDTPTLSVRANVPRAGRYAVSLRYLATGLNWSADYVARVNPGGRTLNLSGWITLANFSDTGFIDAPVDVVAGRLATTGQDHPIEPAAPDKTANCWPAEIDWSAQYKTETVEFSASRINLMDFAMPAPAAFAARTIVARDLGDHKLYALPQAATVAARQTKQVQFFDSRQVPFQKIYRGSNTLLPRSGTGDVPAAIILKVKNVKADGLGQPLPAGGIATMVEQGGQPLLAGEQAIDDTPSGLPLEISAGQSLDVSAQAQWKEVSSFGPAASPSRRGTVDVTITNRKAVAVSYEWRQPSDVDDLKVLSENRRHGTQPGNLSWTLSLKPGQKFLLRYTLQWRGPA